MPKAKSSDRGREVDVPSPVEDQPSQTENIISIILGLAVVLVIGAMIINAIRGKQQQPSSTQPQPTQQAGAGSTTPGNTHTVVAGETLWSIAEKYYNDGFKWTEIKKANNLKEDTVEVGTKLIIPEVSKTPQLTQGLSPQPTAIGAQSPTPTTEAAGSTGPTGTSGQTLSTSTDTQYTVVAGDTLWDIAAKKYNDPYKWVDIAKANSLKNPDLIYPGNVFVLP